MITSVGVPAKGFAGSQPSTMNDHNIKLAHHTCSFSFKLLGAASTWCTMNGRSVLIVIFIMLCIAQLSTGKAILLNCSNIPSKPVEMQQYGSALHCILPLNVLQYIVVLQYLTSCRF